MRACSFAKPSSVRVVTHAFVRVEHDFLATHAAFFVELIDMHRHRHDLVLELAGLDRRRRFLMRAVAKTRRPARA